jgi:hypothetical protein
MAVQRIIDEKYSHLGPAVTDLKRVNGRTFREALLHAKLENRNQGASWAASSWP